MYGTKVVSKAYWQNFIVNNWNPLTDLIKCYPMSKIILFAKAISVAFLLIVSVSMHASVTSTSESVFSYEKATDEVLEQRIRNLQSHVDLQLNSDVKRYIEQYTVQYRHSAEHLLGKVAQYFPLFEDVFRNDGVPDEIKYLAIVESNLRPHVTSRYGAAGMWQFMRQTGKIYDLHQDKYVDERRDPLKSTRAASAYLSDLYEMFGDWTLALAAYNCGPGRVRAAIKKAGKKDYWSIQKYLPKETRQYIPRFIAANYVVNYYHAHELNPQEPEIYLSHTGNAKVFDDISFKKISQFSGVDLAMIKTLNPEYIRSFIPESEGKYILTLPINELYEFANSQGEGFEIVNEGPFYIVPAIVNEETQEVSLNIAIEKLNSILTSITEDTSSESYFEEDNDQKLPLRIQPNANTEAVHEARPRAKYEYHILTSYESLHEIIEERKDINLEEINRLNEFSKSNPPLPGSLIKIKELD